MNRAMTKSDITGASPRFRSRAAYVYYLLIIVTGVVVLFAGSRLNFLVDMIATAFYVAVTALFYTLTKRA